MFVLFVVLLILFPAGIMCDSVSEKVDRIIAEHNVAIFSKSYCPYSLRAKSLLLPMDPSAFVVELDQDRKFSSFFL